jgi:hypothetical protein
MRLWKLRFWWERLTTPSDLKRAGAIGVFAWHTGLPCGWQEYRAAKAAFDALPTEKQRAYLALEKRESEDWWRAIGGRFDAYKLWIGRDRKKYYDDFLRGIA